MTPRDAVQRNIHKLASSGKSQDDIDNYVKMEGYDPSTIFDQEQPTSEPGSDPRIEKELGPNYSKGFQLLKSAAEMNPIMQGLKLTEAATGGASEDLLPLAGQLIGGSAAAAGEVTAPWAIAAAGAGGGLGEVARQGVRKLRGKDTSNYTKDVLKETALSAGAEGAFRGAMKGAEAVSKTPFGRATINGFANAMERAKGLGAKGQQAVAQVLNFMGDLKPGTVEYAIKRGPSNLFTPKNLAEDVLPKTAKNVVDRLEQMRVGANKAFTSTLDNFYKKEYLRKYPYAGSNKIAKELASETAIFGPEPGAKVLKPRRVTKTGLAKIKEELRFYPWRVAEVADQAMKDYGFLNRAGRLKSTVLGDLGSRADEGQMLTEVINKIKSYKKMTPDDALTLRQEINDIIYDGWKLPKTKTNIGQPTSEAKSVLKSINKELSDRLHARIKGLKPMDDAYQQVMDLTRRAKPFYGDTDKAEKFMRKYASGNLTGGEREIINEVDKHVPHAQLVVDHLKASEFKSVISNFWKSRALASLIAGGEVAGFATGHGLGAGVAGAGALAASSPRLIRAGLEAAEGASGAARAIGKVAKASAKPLAKAALAHPVRSKKNKSEKKDE